MRATTPSGVPQFGSSTILYGSGADGNYDGVIDAADYMVWRKSLAASAGGAESVRQPPACPNRPLSALVGLATATLCCCLCRRMRSA